MTQTEVIRKVLDALDHSSSLRRTNVRDILLAQFGPDIIPVCMEKFADTPAEYRADLVRFVLRYAQTDPRAVGFAILALNDRSRMVRHNACAVLAYSLNPAVLEALNPLLNHADESTRDDAARAIAAIKAGNHNKFYPGHSGWGIFPDDPDQPRSDSVEHYITAIAPELVAPLTAILGDLTRKWSPPGARNPS